MNPDPLVPINAARLRLAMGGVSVNELAKLSNEKQQTLNLILLGRTRRCRSSRRDTLAGILGVEAEWLSNLEPPSGRFFDAPSLDARIDASETLHAAETPASFRRLMRRVQLALVRDGIVPSETARSDNATLLARLVHPTWWSVALVDAPPGKRGTGGMTADPQLRDHLARAFEVILGPWLDGHARLNHAGFRALLRVLDPTPKPRATHRKKRTSRRKRK